MKHINEYSSFDEYENNLSKAILNTKTFNVSKDCEKFLHNQKGWLNGCFNCNEITDLIFTKYSGNNGILCICEKCGKYILFDKNKERLYDYYMEQKLKKDMNKYNI